MRRPFTSQTHSSSMSTSSSREVQCFLLGVFVTVVVFVLVQLYIFPLPTLDTAVSKLSVQTWISESSIDQKAPDVPMIPFPEPAWRTPNTLAVTTVASTPFARFEIHKVKTESGEIVNDWLWTDERAHANILVHLEKEDKYMLFYQMKYGLEKPYYAAVGGLFNVGDTPLECARRELLEETGLEAKEMIYLGKYRVQVNRGGGILHAFYAKNSFPSKIKKYSDDYEKQEKRLLTRKELIDIVLKGEIGEAQWLAAIATGLLYEEHLEHHPRSLAHNKLDYHTNHTKGG